MWGREMASWREIVDFRLMSFAFAFRDLFVSPRRRLEEVGLREGQVVLDFGCGPGSYTIAAARIVGGDGMVYAVDVNPLAVEAVRRRAKRRRLANVKVLLSDCATGLEAGSVDVVLAYDVLHEITEPKPVLAELRRVLKPYGVLSVSDHHMREDEIVETVSGAGFSLDRRMGWGVSFRPA